MLDQVLQTSEFKPDYDLNVMQPSQAMRQLTARLISGIEQVFQQI
jgi:UDP-N-acetylglucosamine 2-epimerase (non-hydrolysing)